MKKIFSVLFIGSFLYSCTNTDNMNTDPNSSYSTVPSTLLSYAQKELSDFVNTPSVNENNFRLTMQYWQETTYVEESNYDFVTRNVSNSVWIDCYVNVLNNLNQAKQIISTYNPTASEAPSWPIKKKNQIAIIDMQMVYTYQLLTDIFGDIPYTESLNLASNQLPVYDNDTSIYSNLITRLSTDISNLDTSGGSFDSGDYYYSGNVSKWKKFGNTLLLKLGITIADINPTLAQNTVNTAIGNGVFTSSADDCKFNYLSSSPNYSPLFENLVASNRNDFVAGKTIIDYMNSLSDPRRTMFFEPTSGTTYVGAIIGNPASFSSNSHIGNFANTETTPGVLLNYTETAFYLAEASARWTPSLATTNYNKAVITSFIEWGLSLTDATTYLTSNPYNSVNWKQSLGNQAWIAMYNQPITSWTFYRRLDYPQLIASASSVAIASGKIPVRLTYPVKETTTNPTNLATASSAIGGDNLTTKIFWDVN
ncbi:SusD/RagB family nutrient-binding outer membrane lipoprotein [Flavobacterium sp.]|uniref:SusD/RagB family nutrient-binding outer membrane lipoprotein n=1 Tax=Flavobacterium sp. TaxID=239 RepID=UPI003BEB57CB